MKKLLSFMMLAAMLLTACVKQEKFSDEIGDKTTLTFTVGTGQIATRAAVDPVKGDATRLWVGVYYKNGTEYEHMAALDKNVSVETWPTTVSIDVARNETYKLVFWADNITEAEAFTISKETGIISETATTQNGNLENRDAYYKMIEITPAGSISGEVTLVRPMAQINIGTSDLAAFKAASMYEGTVKTKVVVEGVATAMNLLTGEASGDPGTITFDYAAERDAEITADGVNYDYLVLNYVLAPEAATAKATVRLSKDGETDINAFEVSNLPVKPNYRTNIVGKLLTGTATYTVNVDQNFEGDLDKKVGPVFESLDDLNAYFAKLKTGPLDLDNGDIFPEAVVLKALGTVEGTPTITLPNDTLSVAITILKPYDAEAGITIAYPTAEGAKHSNNVYFNMAGLKKLTANLPDTHLEVVSGSNIDLSDVHTSAGTFVVQKGARVGTLNIKQGNAYVAGSIDSLKVNPSATSDGQASGAENAVKVFLAKESAVEKIVLNSKTDVVVEQPKDNIDASTTENKVEVVVKATAAGSSATAQNGGDIYVRAEGVCTVSANGAEEGNAENNSTVYVAPTTSTVEGTQSGAGEILSDDPSTVSMYVAQIGDVKYASLVEAVAAVPTTNAETTITMIGDDAVENGITIPAEKNIILELAGFTVSGNTNSANTYALITNRGTLTIQDKTDTKKDGTGSGLLTTYITNADQQDVPGYASNTITNNGTLTVKSGKIVNNGNGYACYAIDNQTNGSSYSPVVKIEGGRMEQMREETYAVRMFCNSETNTNSVEITGGVINGGYGIWLQTPSANIASNASLTISGGEFISRDGGSFIGYNKSASRENISVIISGGKFTGDPNGLVIQGLNDGVAGYKEFSISGGVFNGIAAGGNLGKFITGGTFGNDPSDYVDKDYEACFDDEADVWNVVRKPDAAQVGDKTYTSLVDAFEAAQAGDEVKMVKNMYIEATVPAPYGNKCGIKQNGEILNGQNYNLYLTTGGDQYTIMTSGGTIKNLTIASGFRAILLMYPQTDVYIDNVTSGPGVCYAINTAEQGNPDARIIATNSTFLGWCSFSLIASASFTNCKFGQGTYYTNTWGRYIRPYVTTTFTNCEFGYNCAEGDKYYLDLCALVPGQTIKMINCKVGDTVITAENIADLLDGSDESNNNYSFDKSIFEIIQFE